MLPRSRHARRFPALTVGLLLAAAGVMLAPARGRAQTAPEKKQTTTSPGAPAKKQKDQIKLLDATRVSTALAARQAAHQAAQAENGKQPAAKPSAAPAPADGVVELKPAAPSQTPDGSKVTVPAKKPSPLKSIHGSVYGATDPQDPGARRTGGDVGATTKSGKTSVYVKAEQGRSNPTPPQ